MKNDNKRVNVYDKAKQTIMRTPYSIAMQLIATGNYTLTSKGKLKSFLNREGKMYRNSNSLAKFDFESIAGKMENKVVQDRTGKTYAIVARRTETVIKPGKKGFFKKEEDKKETHILRAQVFLVRYPN